MLINQKAFTLIELIVSLAILGVIIGLALPGFNTMVINQRSSALGEDFAAAVNFVRSESVKQGARISLCASDNGTACQGNWTDGYIAFIDTALTDKATTPVLGANSVLKVWDKPNSNAVITVKSDSDALTFIRFTALGTLAKVKDKPLKITISMKKCTGDAAREINVGLSGMVNIDRSVCQVLL